MFLSVCFYVSTPIVTDTSLRTYLNAHIWTTAIFLDPLYMAIFNSKLLVYQRVFLVFYQCLSMVDGKLDPIPMLVAQN